MNPWYTRSARSGLAIFGIAMAGLAVWAYWRFGMTWLTAVVVGIVIVCAVAALYAWWLAHRALRSLDNAKRSDPRRTT